MLAAINFVIEISALPISAAIIIFFDPEAIENLEEYFKVARNKLSFMITRDFLIFIITI